MNEYFSVNKGTFFLPIIVGIVNYSDVTENISYDDISMYKYGFENIISEVLNEISDVKTANMGKELIGVFLYSEKTFNYDEVKKKVKLFENAIRKNFRAELFTVIGTETEEIMSAYEQIPSLINAQKYKFIKDENAVLISDVSKENQKVQYPTYIQTEVIIAINSKNPEIFLKSINKFSDYIIKNNSLNGKEWFIKLFLEISESYHNNPEVLIRYNTLEAMMNCDKITEIADMLYHSVEYTSFKNNDDEEKNFDEIVMKIIEKEFSNPNFSIQTMIDEFDITASYFGKKFKHTFNMSFNKYLLEYRLNHAIKLLKETDYTNAKIAFLCGFTSENYFMTVFKKTIGISPKEYKNKEI